MTKFALSRGTGWAAIGWRGGGLVPASVRPSNFIARPIDSPIYSSETSRHRPQDQPRWRRLAPPFSQGSFISYKHAGCSENTCGTACLRLRGLWTTILWDNGARLITRGERISRSRESLAGVRRQNSSFRSNSISPRRGFNGPVWQSPMQLADSADTDG
jgi:hypothetical protein